MSSSVRSLSLSSVKSALSAPQNNTYQSYSTHPSTYQPTAQSNYAQALNQGPSHAEIDQRSTSTASSARVTNMIRTLIRKLVKNPAQSVPSETTVDRLLSYCLRILASRLYPTALRDESQIAEFIKKKLVHDGKVQQSVRFDELLELLMSARHEILREKWSILYLLLTLSGSTGVSHADSSSVVNIPLDKPFSSNIGLSLTSALDGTMLASTATYKSALVEDVSGMLPTSITRARAQSRMTRWPSTPGTATSILGAAREPSDGETTDRASAMRRNYVEQLVKENTAYEISEEQLLRDVIFNFQGIDGQYVKYDTAADAYQITPDVGVPLPTRALVKRICELGWIYRRITQYLQRTMKATSVGLVEQSFCGALEQELTDYYRLIAVLEAQLNQSLSLSSAPRGPTPQYQFTLRRMFVWIQEPLERLRLMAMLADAADGQQGGALVSAVCAYLRHGDPFYIAFVKRIMKQVCKPIFLMIQRWISSGDLQDPFGEFFVAVDVRITKDRLWQDKYSLRQSMLPSFINHSLAKKILMIGKSINFIRLCCEEGDFSSDTRGGSAASSRPLDYSNDESDLEIAVNEAARITNQRLLEIMMDKFRLQSHLLALKKYLLLGQGDFAQLLMDLLCESLDKSAKLLYRHNAMNLLESAVRASNAQYEDQIVLDRLSVKLLKDTENEVGWDIFLLDYLTSSPLNVILSEKSIGHYHRVFSFLWSLKRFGTKGRRGGRGGASSAVQNLVHRFFLLRAQMLHLVQNLNSYMMFEVMECAWTDLLSELALASDMEALLAAHDRYLQQIVEKALLGPSAQVPVLNPLKKIFECILQFTREQNQLFSELAAKLQQQELAEQDNERRSAQGQWAVEDASAPSASDFATLMRDSGKKLTAMQATFQKLLDTFFNALRNHRAIDLRFLLLRLDFNEYYSRHSESSRALTLSRPLSTDLPSESGGRARPTSPIHSVASSSSSSSSRSSSSARVPKSREESHARAVNQHKQDQSLQQYIRDRREPESRTSKDPPPLSKKSSHSQPLQVSQQRLPSQLGLDPQELRSKRVSTRPGQGDAESQEVQYRPKAALPVSIESSELPSTTVAQILVDSVDEYGAANDASPRLFQFKSRGSVSESASATRARQANQHQSSDLIDDSHAAPAGVEPLHSSSSRRSEIMDSKSSSSSRAPAAGHSSQSIDPSRVNVSSTRKAIKPHTNNNTINRPLTASADSGGGLSISSGPSPSLSPSSPRNPRSPGSASSPTRSTDPNLQ